MTEQLMNARPNILFVMSDQHSPRFLGFDGHPVVRTPHLDRLSREAVTFTNAYCQNPLCVPSRASLLTGRYCRNIGIYDNSDILEHNSPTFPRVLSAAGYRTCLIGKAHFNGQQFHGYQQRPYGDLFGQAHQPDPGRTDENGASGLVGWFENAGPTGIPLALTQTEICVAESAKWLQGHARLHPDQPFCLSVHFDKPHFPINPPEEYFEHYNGRVKLAERSADSSDSAVPFVRRLGAGSDVNQQLDAAVHEKALAAYCGCVEWIDDAFGRIVNVLEYLGLSQNTIVIYSSDHGEMASEHGLWQKTAFFEASARVPLLVRWPEQAQAGTRCDQIVGLLDLFPTLCAAAGAPVPEVCDGVSLLPALQGSDIGREGLFSESVVLGAPEHAGCMLRTGDLKYCRYLDAGEELYDLKADPGESVNLASDPRQASVVQSFRQQVEAFWEPEKQMERYRTCPRMAKEKHFYPYSNQFVSGDGTIVDAAP
jgi:choline-sulfatase